MTWTVEDVEQRDGYVSVGGDPSANDPELALGVVLLSGGLAWGAWATLADVSTVGAGVAVVAVGALGVALLVAMARSGLAVGRRGLRLRWVLRPRVDVRWRDVRSIAVVERPHTRWRVLRIETKDGRTLWAHDVRTEVGVVRRRWRRPVEPGGPGFADEVAARLEELRRRAVAGTGGPAD